MKTISLASLRPYLPFLLGLGALFLLHLHLQNYTSVTTNVSRLRAPAPAPPLPDEVIKELLKEHEEKEEKEEPAPAAGSQQEAVVSGSNKEFTLGRPDLVVPAGTSVNTTNMKYILTWGEAYGTKRYGFDHGQKRFIENNCKVQNCFTTDNRSYLPSVDQFDVIMFHQRSMTKSDLPKVRRPEQIYIMWMMESASYPFGWHGNNYIDFFNWTMTYRESSTFFHPYGRIYNTKPHPTEEHKLKEMIEQFGLNNQHLAAGKTKKVAWFVSNCRSMSGREQYVKKLQQYIQVDIYGNCGPFKCPRKTNHECWKMVEKEYKFYLSFENSICLDYVTEKFFDAMNRTVVPITLGGTDYSKIAPSNSSINVIPDYVDPKALADYLHYLDQNDAKYAEFFWWKPFYWNSWPLYERGKAYCDLCEMLHWQGDGAPKASSISKLHDWWTVDAHCENVMNRLKHG